ncbi:hypothetical protein [Roseateles sp.]|uniref:hypothetical protein n=1 Tax=Roseateles sp. TaxID=1971397 RepID=UPI00392ED257
MADADLRVSGYYAMADAVSHQAAATLCAVCPTPFQLVLARLAVDHRAQGRQLGGPAARRRMAITVSQHTGVRAILVHALHDRARQFYEHYGFQASSLHPMTLMLRLTTVKP